MERPTRVQWIDTLLAEAEHTRTALTHAFQAKERAEQEKESTHGAPLTDEEEGLQYAHGLWQKVEIGGAALRNLLEELEPLERQRGVSQ